MKRCVQHMAVVAPVTPKDQNHPFVVCARGSKSCGNFGGRLFRPGVKLSIDFLRFGKSSWNKSTHFATIRLNNLPVASLPHPHLGSLENINLFTKGGMRSQITSKYKRDN